MTGLRRAIAAVRRAGNAAAESVLRRLGPGRPLPNSERERLEAALGGDLRGVRLVEGEEARSATRTLDAHAFAAGDTIVLGSTEGAAREPLLAHEAAHVLQQREAGVLEEVGSSNDPAEMAAQRAADGASDVAARDRVPAPGAAGWRSVSGPVPALQRQFAGDWIRRAEAKKRIQRYLEREQARQGAQRVRATPELKAMLRRIFLNDFATQLKLDTYFARTALPGKPAELAADIARYLPEWVDPSRLKHLEASTGPPPTKAERVGKLVEETAPAESPEHQEQKWAFDRMAKEAREGEGAVGPYGLDLQRGYNILRGLPKALNPPPAPPPKSKRYKAVESVIATISAGALIPAEAKGTSKADEFADARELARGVARDLDLAQRNGPDSIVVRLGANYNTVKDRVQLADEVKRIILLVRDALPHRAARVTVAEVYFGERRVRRVVLAQKTSE